MKKKLMRVLNANPSAFFKATAFVLVLSSASYVVKAAPDPGIRNTVVKHLSTTSEAMLFEVNFANETGEKFTLIIKDNTGATLYRGVYNDKNFTRKFQLPKTENDKLVFIVKSASGNTTESFEINSNTRLVEEVVVTKVN